MRCRSYTSPEEPENAARAQIRIRKSSRLLCYLAPVKDRPHPPDFHQTEARVDPNDLPATVRARPRSAHSTTRQTSSLLSPNLDVKSAGAIGSRFLKSSGPCRLEMLPSHLTIRRHSRLCLPPSLLTPRLVAMGEGVGSKHLCNTFVDQCEMNLTSPSSPSEQKAELPSSRRTSRNCIKSSSPRDPPSSRGDGSIIIHH